MNATLITGIIAALIIITLVIVWIVSANNAKSRFNREMMDKEADLIRKDAQIDMAEALRASDKEQYDKAMAEIKASHEKAIEELKAGHEKAIGAAWKAVNHGIKQPTGHVLPPVSPTLLLEE